MLESDYSGNTDPLHVGRKYMKRTYKSAGWEDTGLAFIRYIGCIQVFTWPGGTALRCFHPADLSTSGHLGDFGLTE